MITGIEQGRSGDGCQEGNAIVARDFSGKGHGSKQDVAITGKEIDDW